MLQQQFKKENTFVWKRIFVVFHKSTLLLLVRTLLAPDLLQFHHNTHS